MVVTRGHSYSLRVCRIPTREPDLDRDYSMVYTTYERQSYGGGVTFESEVHPKVRVDSQPLSYQSEELL